MNAGLDAVAWPQVSVLGPSAVARGRAGAVDVRRPAGVPITLADGRRVQLRPLRADDAEATQAFVRALSPASRHARFHIGLHELPPTLLRRMTDVDQRCHVALLAAARLDDGVDGRMVAEARYVMTGTDEAEFALAVADDWQRRGLGRELLGRLARHAGRRGVRRLYGEVLHSNEAMLRLVQQHGARFTDVPGSALLTLAVLDLRRAAA